MAPSFTPWTEDRVQLLRDCIAEKLSATQTAAAMGMRKNSVVGKAHRIGLKFLSQPGHSVESRSRAGKIKRGRLSNATRFLAKAHNLDPGEAALPPQITPPEFLGLTLMELGNRQCHYIPGNDRLYCGQPTEGESSYCGWCRKIIV